MQNLLNSHAPTMELCEDHIFRRLFESSVEGMIILNQEGKILSVNPSCLKMFGYKKIELVDEPIEKLFPQGYQVFYQEEERTKDGIEPILEGLHKKRWLFPVSVSVSQAVLDSDHLIIGFFVDATERIKAEQERSQFSKILDEALNEIYIVDDDSWDFLSVNKGTLHHLGYSLEEMNQMTLMDIDPMLSKKEMEQLIYPIATGSKRKIHFETLRRRKNGSTYPVEVHIQHINYFDKKAFLVMAMDITERKHFQQKIIGALVDGQEKERKRIAKELHDGLGQYLSAASFNLDTLEFDLQKGHIEKEVVRNLRKIIQDSIQELKGISKDLHPRILENQGLAKALEALCESIGRSTPNDLNIDLHIHDLDDRLPQSIEIGLYRTIQELLNNMLKHAKATEVVLQLVKHHDSVLLLFEDNGIGFETRGLNEYTFEGLGVRNIITQVKALSGTYHFDSGPQMGTSVTIEIPLPQNHE